MKKKLAIIHKSSTVAIKFRNFIILLFIPAFFSCAPTNPYHESNYFSGSKFYNDSLKISAKLFGDMKFSEPNRKTFRSFKKAEGLKYNNLLFTATTFVEPLYDLLFFYEEEKLGQYSKIAEPITKLIYTDSTNQNILFQKSFNGKFISIYLISQNGKSSVLEDGKQIIENIKFDISAKDDLTYS